MKKAFLVPGIVALFMAACSSGENNTTAETTTPVAAATTGNGEALIKKSDCIGCHRLDQKVIGPSYLDIAAKYSATEENINTLAEHVITGSKDTWGTIPMTPHPNVSQDDAKEMVRYILSLKK